MLKTISGFALAIFVAGAALAAPALTGFGRDTSAELFGYYQPSVGIKIGHFTLDHLHIGMADDLKKWEKGQGRLPSYAPVMFQFTDLASKMVRNEENGQMYHQNTPRVLPTAYRIKGNAIAFLGSSKEIGAVSFTGTIDIKAIAALNAKAGTETGVSQSERPVIRGDLTIAGKLFKNVGFSWSAGD